MQKSSNNNINGLPDYLDRFKFKDGLKVQQVAKQILQNSYDYKSEENRLKNLIKQVHKFERLGGPSSKAEFEGYPGDEKYIKHLEESMNFKLADKSDQEKIRRKMMEKYGSGTSLNNESETYSPSPDQSKAGSYLVTKHSKTICERGHRNKLNESSVASSALKSSSKMKMSKIGASQQSELETPTAYRSISARKSKKQSPAQSSKASIGSPQKVKGQKTAHRRQKTSARKQKKTETAHSVESSQSGFRQMRKGKINQSSTNSLRL